MNDEISLFISELRSADARGAHSLGVQSFIARTSPRTGTINLRACVADTMDFWGCNTAHTLWAAWGESNV